MIERLRMNIRGFGVSMVLGALLLVSSQAEAQDAAPERLGSRKQPVTRSQSIALSAVFPGLGQLATGHRNRGTALVTAELACLVIWLTSHEDFDTQKTQFEIESQRYLSLREDSSFEDAEASWQRLSAKKDDLDGSHTRRRLFGVLAAAVYGYSLVDVLLLSGGEEPQAAGSVRVVPMVDVDTRATGVAVVHQF
jgi:hypothetical protein